MAGNSVSSSTLGALSCLSRNRRPPSTLPRGGRFLSNPPLGRSLSKPPREVRSRSPPRGGRSPSKPSRGGRSRSRSLSKFPRGGRSRSRSLSKLPRGRRSPSKPPRVLRPPPLPRPPRLAGSLKKKLASTVCFTRPEVFGFSITSYEEKERTSARVCKHTRR